MAKILVLYQSSWGHMEKMAYAAAEGVKQGGGEVVVKRVPDLVAEDVARKAGMKLDQPAPVATVEELPQYDGVILGIPTRYGRMIGAMANFWDQTGALWASHKMVGKVGAVMSSTATQHGGQETTITSFHTTLLHHGMIVVGMPYTAPGITTMREVTGGTPYGASSITGAGEEMRMPTELELGMCRFQGEHVASIVRDLVAGRARAAR
jgi:NAD(P)H dehydrogenase (quinone)